MLHVSGVLARPTRKFYRAGQRRAAEVEQRKGAWVGVIPAYRNSGGGAVTRLRQSSDTHS